MFLRFWKTLTQNSEQTRLAATRTCLAKWFFARQMLSRQVRYHALIQDYAKFEDFVAKIILLKITEFIQP
jgi:hypothetical protein